MIISKPIGRWIPDAPDTDSGLSLINGFACGYGAGLSNINGFTTLGTKDNHKFSGGCFQAQFGTHPSGSQTRFYAQSNTDGKIYEGGDPATNLPWTFADCSVAFSVGNNPNPFVMYGDNVIFFNGIDHAQVEQAGVAPFFPLITSVLKPKCRYAGVSNNHLIMARDATNKDTVYWSAIDDATDFDPALQTGAGNQKLVDNPGQITGVYCGDTNLIFKFSGITLMTYEGHPWSFGFKTLSRTHGTIAPGSIVEKGRNVYFLSSDGFKRVVDRSFIEPVGNGKIERFFRSRENPSAVAREIANNIIGTYDSYSGLITWAYYSYDVQNSSPGGSTNQRNCLLIYDESTDDWSFVRLSSPSIIGVCRGYQQENFESDPLSTPIFITYSGTTSTVSQIAQKKSQPFTSTLPYSFTTKRLVLAEDTAAFVRAVRLVAKFGEGTAAVPTGTFTVYLSNDPTFVTYETPTIDSTPKDNGWVIVRGEGQFCKVAYSGGPDTDSDRFFNDLLYIQFDVDFGGSISA